MEWHRVYSPSYYENGFLQLRPLTLNFQSSPGIGSQEYCSPRCPQIQSKLEYP